MIKTKVAFGGTVAGRMMPRIFRVGLPVKGRVVPRASKLMRATILSSGVASGGIIPGVSRGLW